MAKKGLLLIICLLLVATFLAGCQLPSFRKKKAALQVTSNPKTTVFLDEKHLGQTPFFDEKIKPGEYTLKLVPDQTDIVLSSWQTRVKLNSGILTVVNRNIGITEDESSGYTLTLEKITDKEKASIAVVSTPDSCVVNLDGEPKGFAPISLEDISEGDHLLTISTPGYREETIKAKTVKGYKLTVNVQLAKAPEGEKSEEATESAKEETTKKPASTKTFKEEIEESSPSAAMERPYVKIKETSTGWLNVRSEPSTAGKEETIVIKIHPGEVYKFIESNDTGWYKIEYKEGEQGWISGQYAELYK
jgi:hypothetical protein